VQPKARVAAAAARAKGRARDAAHEERDKRTRLARANGERLENAL
jgi:hypothetical protein